jgi:hypothetical protein
MPADVFGECVDDEPRADRLRAKQRGRRHRVVDDEQDAARGAQRADTREVGDLRSRIGDRLDEHQARGRRQGAIDGVRVGRIDVIDRGAVRGPRFEHADRVAEKILAGHDVVAFTGERHQDRADRRHACCERDACDALFHCAYFGFERSGGRITLTTVREALRAPLENGSEVSHIAITVGDGQVQRLVQCAVLDAGIAVRVKDRSGETAAFRSFAHVDPGKRKARSTSAERASWRLPEIRRAAALRASL